MNTGVCDADMFGFFFNLFMSIGNVHYCFLYLNTSLSLLKNYTVLLQKYLLSKNNLFVQFSTLSEKSENGF